MNLSLVFLLTLILLMLFAAILLTGRILINKLITLEDLYTRNHRRLSAILSLVAKNFEGTFDSLRELKEIRELLVFERIEEALQHNDIKRFEQREIRKLRSWRPTRRKEACSYLGLIGSESARKALERALTQEGDYSVRIYISNALTDIRNPESLPVMIDALVGTRRWYRDKAISNLLEFGSDLYPYLERLRIAREMELMELLIRFAGENLHTDLKHYLFELVDHFDDWVQELEAHYAQPRTERRSDYKADYVRKDMDTLLEYACRVLSNVYFTDFAKEVYWRHSHPTIRTNAIWAASKVRTTSNVRMLIEQLRDGSYEKALLGALGQMVEANPRFLYLVEDAFAAEEDPAVRKRLARVLSSKIEYYLLKLRDKGTSRAGEILKAVIGNGEINELIGFLNKNRDIDLENAVIQILKEAIIHESPTEQELRAYLSPSILIKWGVEPAQENEPPREQPRDPQLVVVVLLFTALCLGIFPMIYLLRHPEMVQRASMMANARQYVMDFNYYLAYYSAAINTVYLILLALSFVNLRKQSALWNIKNISMLFRNRMLPSISIIAPAYNEEKTIIASANSLLNLKYPEYELIIVNDGSKDETLNQLIQHFQLVRVDYLYTPSLATAPIRGIYRNPSLPRLLVVDKSNGGKADSLNAGINISNKEYFCGIDADSLLETEALLKLASLTLDESTETPALGGNIFPLNGCTVERGLITEIRLPKSTLARFQTIEYIRAFMAGRLGWEQINGLLIISGAFGLFRKERILGIGGYLTKKGQYKKDTVGEDMELVVRISRMMHEAGQRMKILYAFNANCWTEVPEDLGSLRNQRTRWHRGLIDILYFHRRMLFSRRYGMTGLIAMPYFLIFEAIGPMIEWQGYLMVVLAAFLGILNPQIALLLFITTILLGVIVSLASLLIAEKETHYFSLRDVMTLIAYAVIENFGPRQIFSFWRLQGQYRVVFGHQGWGTVRRKGV